MMSAAKHDYHYPTANCGSSAHESAGVFIIEAVVVPRA